MTVLEARDLGPEMTSTNGSYLERIGRPDLKDVLTSQTPLAYWTMEIYRHDIKGQGGLGMLASDTAEVARKAGLPMWVMTPLYPVENTQVVEGFEQKMVGEQVDHEARGFDLVDKVEIYSRDTGAGGDVIIPTTLDVKAKQEGSVTLLGITEPFFRELYADGNNSDHRLYQEVALGFGGYQALRRQGIEPASHQLNEAPTVFAAIARLDEKMRDGQSFNDAMSEVRENTVYTNHTLVQAVEAVFSKDQIERFVIPNIQNADIQSWLGQLVDSQGGHIRLSTLALELAGKYNGVSRIHALKAGEVYQKADGGSVAFEPVTNGLSIDRWGDPKLLHLYRENGVLDGFDLPTDDMEEALGGLDSEALEDIKDEGRGRLRDVLTTRQDQYGQPVHIPEGAKVINWRRRLHDYKRPGMPFTHPDRLAAILRDNDAHFILAGKAHPSDIAMQEELSRILEVIDQHPDLKERVHYIANYDEDLARALVQGADVSMNTPIYRDHTTGEVICTEACGTSWEKDVLNRVIMVSTDDGGARDLTVLAQQRGVTDFEPPYLQIKGDSPAEEVGSMYSQMEKAMRLVDDQEAKDAYLGAQLAAYLPIISGARMEADYLDLEFPRQTSHSASVAA